MKRFIAKLSIGALCVTLSGCMSLAAYTLSDNGCFKSCPPKSKTKYYLGTQMSGGMITTPIIGGNTGRDITLKSLMIIDFPFTVMTDTLFVPFIAIKNATTDFQHNSSE